MTLPEVKKTDDGKFAVVWKEEVYSMHDNEDDAELAMLEGIEILEQ